MKMICDQKPVKKKGVYLPSELKFMAEDKTFKDTSKKHWRHKPYTSDFGGNEDERHGTPPSSLLL